MSNYITWDDIVRRKRQATDRSIEREIAMEDGTLPLPVPPVKKTPRKPLRSLKGGGTTAGDFAFCFLRVDR